MSFRFFLARELGMTVAHLEATMSNQEFVAWHVYYGRRAQKIELEKAKAT